MKKLSEITVLVVDCGEHVELARIMGKSCKKVYYYNASRHTSYPKIGVGLIGSGFKELEVVDSMLHDFDNVDLYLFAELGFAQDQLTLEALGKHVWGARNGEEMEIDRPALKRYMQKIGLPVGKFDVGIGIKSARAYLKQHENQFVKISKWRGEFESFFSKNYKNIEYELDEIEHTLGGLKEAPEFTFEDDLPDKVEVGVDNYNIDGEMPESQLYGIEVKDLGYCGIFTEYAKIPEPVRRFNDKMTKVFQNYGFKGFCSTEVRIGKDKIPYIIDLVSGRQPSPPGELYQVFYKNLAEIIWQGANGVCIDPDPISKYGCQLILSCNNPVNYQPVQFPTKYADLIKLKNSIMVNGQICTVPTTTKEEIVGAVLGYGNTMDSAIEMAKEVAKAINNSFLKVNDGSLDTAKEEIEKLEGMDLWIK